MNERLDRGPNKRGLALATHTKKATMAPHASEAGTIALK